MIIWMKVSKDSLELPEAIADTAEELAEICGVDPTTVIGAARRYEQGKVAFSVYRRIEIEEEEEWGE